MYFLTRIFLKAVQPTFRIFDVVGFAAIPIIQTFNGDKLTDIQIAQIIVYAGSGIVLMRLIVAPYLIWKEDQAEIANLKSELDKPVTIQKLKMAENFAEKRTRLAELIGEIVSLSQAHIPTSTNRPSGVIHAQKSEAESLLMLFSDEDDLVSNCRHQMQLAAIIIDAKDNHEDYKKDLNEMIAKNRDLAPLLRGVNSS